MQVELLTITYPHSLCNITYAPHTVLDVLYFTRTVECVDRSRVQLYPASIVSDRRVAKYSTDERRTGDADG